MKLLYGIFIVLAVFTLNACSMTKVIDSNLPESERANAMFEELYMEQVRRSPELQTSLGIKWDYDKWDNLSEEYIRETHELHKAQLARLNTLDAVKLDEETLVSYSLFRQNLENAIADFKWRDHDYPVNQMFGVHSNVPSLLINQHSVASVADAEAYIARLNAVPALFDQLTEGLERRAVKGIIVPEFIIPYVIRDCRNIISGSPFSEGEDGVLLADFRKKVSALTVDETERQRLLQAAVDALVQKVEPAYRKLIVALESLAQLADDRAGVWKLPEGDKFYSIALQRTTTTGLSADEIHEIGLKEVARIHGEMRAIMKQVEFEGNLQDFFEYTRTDPRFYYPNTDAGRQAYLRETEAIIEAMKRRLDKLFIRLPAAELVVKRVEAFREESAGTAFYERPAPDGSRPGRYYVNLYDMGEMPVYQMEALAYHEGVPGHHMQIAIAQEVGDLPKFRRYGFYTAYIEGWGLYAELLPKEIGFYRDPYSDFGRLAMELWRACRLVVDTGLHGKRWSREQAIEYLMENTPNPRTEVEDAIDRYIVMPSQATAYKIGMLKILELRARAMQQLGEEFDIREFHGVVLRNGALPLNILESLVDDWLSGF
jgi:uncharacterized protein (DUF885 family)